MSRVQTRQRPAEGMATASVAMAPDPKFKLSQNTTRVNPVPPGGSRIGNNSGPRTSRDQARQRPAEGMATASVAMAPDPKFKLSQNTTRANPVPPFGSRIGNNSGPRTSRDQARQRPAEGMATASVAMAPDPKFKRS